MVVIDHHNILNIKKINDSLVFKSRIVFWCRGYYADIVEKNEIAIRESI